MSDEINDDNPTPSCESNSDSFIVLVDSSGRTVNLPIGGSSIEESQSLDTSNQAAFQEDAKSRSQDKWKQISEKTYAEIATACPGSKEENFALFGNNHPDSPEEKKLVSISDTGQGQSVELYDHDPLKQTVNQSCEQSKATQEQHTLLQPFADEKHSSQDSKASAGTRQEKLTQESPGSGNAIEGQGDVSHASAQGYKSDEFVEENHQGQQRHQRSSSSLKSTSTLQSPSSHPLAGQPVTEWKTGENLESKTASAANKAGTGGIPETIIQSSAGPARDKLYSVFFYLYTCDEAESVSICVPNNRFIALQEYPPGQKHCWSNGKPFSVCYDQKHFEYHYRAKFKKHVVKRILNFLVDWENSSIPVITEETVRRLIDGTDHFDIFHLPGASDKQRNKAILSGVLHFIDMLYHLLSKGSDFKQTMVDCERICSRLSWTERKDLTEISKWIDKMTRCRIQWYHSAFICSLIGQVENACHAGGILSVMQPQTANALLDLLPAFKFEFIPQKSMAYIKSIATNLFFRSSEKGWLAFLTYFAKMLEVEELLCTAQKLQMSYPDKHFNHHITCLVDMLVSLTEADDQVKVLEFVMDRCSSVTCLWHLHQELSTHSPELTDALAGRFSHRFCQLILSHTRTPKVDLLRHNVWKEMPPELRSSLADSFVEALQHQIAQETNLSTDRRFTLKTYISDKEICSSKHFVPFILGLANNKSEPVFSVLVDVMELEQFSETWRVLSDSEKSAICECLLRNIAGSSPQKNVVQVLKAIRMIGESRALQCDEETQLVLKKCAIEILQNVNLQVMLAAYVDLDRSSQIMESCYSLLLREIVKQKRMNSDDDLSLIKRLLLYLDVKGKENQSDLPSVEFQGTHWEFLQCLLELTVMPGSKEDQNDMEQILRMVMQLEDVWLFLLQILKPSSKLHSHPKVKMVVWAIHCLKGRIKQHSIRVGYLLGLTEEDVNTLAHLCFLIEASEENLSREDPRESMWKTEFIGDWRRAQDFQETFFRVEGAIQFVQKLVEGVTKLEDIPQLITELNHKKKFSNKSLHEVLDSSYLGSLGILTDAAESIHILRDSTAFYNIARSHVVAEGSPVHSNTTLTSTSQVMELLNSQGIPKFQQACNPLFDRNNDLSVDEVNLLLRGITTKEDLHKELQFMSKYFQRSPVHKDKEKMLASFLKYPVLQRKVQILIPALHVFGYNSATFPRIMNILEEFVTPLQMKPMMLSSLCESLESESITVIDRTLDKDLTDIVSVLAESRELLSFIEERINDDMVVLIEVVEEHSDQFISETTVSNLIDVHRFLKNVVKDKPSDVIAFLHQLKNCYDNLSGKPGMAAKIDECSRNVHSLRALYNNFANRGEMTKEIISNALRKGSYQLGRNDEGFWDILLTYRRQTSSSQKAKTHEDSSGVTNSGHDTCYKLTDLQDLRSRALLIVNIDSRHHVGEKHNKVHTGCSAADLNEFVKQVDLLMEILSIAALLHNSGHPDYKTFWVKLHSTKQINEKAKLLAENAQHWKRILETAQKKYFFLNFFHPNQLWILNDFFRSMPGVFHKEKAMVSSVHSLLRFIDPTLQIGALEELSSNYLCPSKRETVEGNLGAIGEALDAFFLPWAASSFSKVPQRHLHGAVQPGELLVAVLEQGSTQTVQVVMSLFELTTGSKPEPSQVLFCHSDTTWEEIQRFLQRSFEGSSHSWDTKLHCLANVDNLANDMQFDLVAAIKEFQSASNVPNLLSLVCRGGPHHHIAYQFADNACNVKSMTDVKLKAKFKEAFPGVFVVTSELAGTGKTESIFDEATRRGKAVASFPISGPLSRNSLVHRLASLHLQECDCIHIDIGEVDDPLTLDTFLFELVVLGMVSSGTLMYHLPTKEVYIEIANTLNNWLQDSLPVTKCFAAMHIKFKGYDNYVVSQEASSPVQVVCNYLHAFDSATLESKEVIFSGPNKAKPLPSDQCKNLLSKYFPFTGETSYNIVENFLGVFADQLLKFSTSPFLKPSNLKAMLGPSPDVRTRLFSAILQVSKEFAARSVATCKAVQSTAMSDRRATDVLKQAQSSFVKSADKIVERTKGMIQWNDNSHLLIVFHTQQELSISALYRDLKLVPPKIQDLFKSQAVEGKGKGLEEYSNLNQEELQHMLDLLTRTSSTAGHADSTFKYALTPDNVLKMVLILLRIRANIPVIIMGETGCGKTSLVRYLAKTCGVPFHVFNFHAGITADQIINFAQSMSKIALSPERKKQPVWIFLDEINTCDHLGVINEIMCHHSLRGKPLPTNLVFIAACNPYRLRPLEKILTPGLSEKASTDENSGLAYRVHPLPETMIDYVWDYGSVGPEDEKRYIARMVEGVFHNTYQTLLVNLLSTSQKYIRHEEKSPYCVSLRDVHRCIVLMKWFHEILHNRKELSPDKIQHHVKVFYQQVHAVSNDIRAIVLALAHCYQSRLQRARAREEFRTQMTRLIEREPTVDFHDESFQAIVRVEQEEYLARMELPVGTAKNAALRENVFVILVCILNCIPIFVVGKPGCSKSLSMQVIRSNLRGKDSKDPFLKQLPQLYVVSYQGSESSTSEGILKVFEKARRYKEEGSNDVLPVVLLDEIGLAEVSAFNPLKVLHNLLEPGNGELPDVAVVGISNWCLDPAKMNRAIHLSRPEPDIKDLFETGQSIREAQHNSPSSICAPHSYPDDYQLNCLANAYQEYQKKQRHENFHGLRDYYSLVKSLSSDCGKGTIPQYQGETEITQRALQRNFGGLPLELTTFQHLFLEHFCTERVIEEIQTFPVTDLICDNLHDKFARHMMIITNGDSAIGILEQTLKHLDKEKVIIFGSRFEEDQSEEYNYSVLSRIILCMEQDCVLILRDLESIYGSLYDMLNQNYTVVGQKKNCRVALGPFSNPMCQVHDEFRCIVLIDERRVDYTDPPFLNRFEKQMLRFSDVLNAEQDDIISCLGNWAKSISTGPELQPHFNETDMFVGFNEDTLPSLVLQISKDEAVKKSEVVEKCKEELTWIASPDGVLRSLRSYLSRKSLEEVSKLYKSYFSKPVHRGLKEYMRRILEELPTNSEGQDGKAECGLRLLVMTHSSIHTNVSQCLTGVGNCQTEKLSAFKSEKQLAKQLQSFWTSDANVLVLQCKPDLDAPHMLVAKHLIEEQRNTHISFLSGNAKWPVKHVCLIVHVQRTGKNQKIESPQWQFNFQSGWRQVTIDMLEEPAMPVTELLDVTVTDLFDTEPFSFERIASDQLLWCFTRIKYQSTEQPPLDEVLHLVKWLRLSPKMMECFKKLVVRFLRRRESCNIQDPLQGLSWQVAVASDRQALVNSSTLFGAIQHHFSHLIRKPLAKVVYFLEKESAWPKEVFSSDPTNEGNLHVWTELLFDESIFKIEDIPDSQGAESYFVSGHRHKLEFPFTSIFSTNVDKVKSLFIEDLRSLQLEDANLDDNGELETKVFEAQLQRFLTEVKCALPQVTEDVHLQSIAEWYVSDLLDLKTAPFSAVLSRNDRINFLKSVVSQYMRVPTGGNVALMITQLHCVVWMKESSFIPALHLYVACRDVVPEVVKNLPSKFVDIFDKVMFDHHCAAVAKSGPAYLEKNKEEMVWDQNKDGGEGNEVSNEVKESEEANGNEIPLTFLELLVQTCCHALFPTDSVVTGLQGPEQWQRSVSRLLSLVSRMQLSVPAFHFLRVCHDFVTLVLLPESMKTYTLYAIGETGLAYEFEGYLDSQECFEKIDQLIDSFKHDVTNVNRLKEFRVLFYTRCIDSNPDTPALEYILSRVSCSGDRALIKLAGPVIHRIFVTENNVNPGVFQELLHDPSIMENHPGLQQVCHALSSLANETELDCPFAVLCCDLISDVGFPPVDFSTISGSDSKYMKSLQKATQILLKPCKEEMDAFSLVCAIAYLRSFLGSFAKLIVQNPRCLASDNEYVMLLRELNPVFTSSENQFAAIRSSQTRLYFLRELRKELPLHTIKKITEESTKLPALEAFDWHHEDHYLVGKLSFDPFLGLTKESTAKIALASLMEEKNQGPLQTALVSLKDSADKIELAAVLTTWLYLPRSVRNMRDSEEKAIDFISDEISSRRLPKPYVSLLQRVIGKKDFQVQELCLSPESSSRDVHRAALILHLCIILTSHFKEPKSMHAVGFLSYLVWPRNSKDTFILASPNSTQHPFETYRNCSERGFSLQRCLCRTVFTLRNHGDYANCPECKSQFKFEVQKIDELSDKPYSSTKGYILVPPSYEESCCVRCLSPSEFRILHLFVHAALYGGIALEMFDANSLSEIMISKDEEESIGDVCFQYIARDLAVLCNLFNRQEEEVLLLLHHILDVTTPILTTVGLCTKEDKRAACEKKFSETISPLLHDFIVNRKINIPMCPESFSAVESQIEEFDNPQFTDTTERNLYIPRLFRVTSSKSFNDLRAYYMHLKKEAKVNHPLLGLFLDFHGSLDMVTHLHNFLVWSRLLEIQLGRRLSRKEASKAMIGDIVRGEHHSKVVTTADKEDLEKAFESFKTSWEKIRPAIIKRVGEDVPHINEMSPVSLCLVERRGQGKFLCTALDILQEIQNDFLQEVLRVATIGKCAALKFLERGEGIAALQMVHLQDAREKEIIHYQWSNDILRHSQQNTEYGHGKEIIYDLGRIEKEMALRFLLGKCYLSTVDDLREFTFAKELFHSCKGILDELERIVPQQPMTEETKSGLRHLKERSLKGVQDLLEHMEIVLCLLKKHQIGNPSEPLIEFTDRWLSESRPFPNSLLPEPRRAVLLTHVVALYEFLEDMLSESAMEGIIDMYRDELPNDVRDQMLSVIDNSTAGTDHLTLESITTALCRFVFRYISADHSRPQPGLSLLEHMLEKSLWPMEVIRERKAFNREQWKQAVSSVIPEALILGHIHAVVSLYRSKIKIFEENKQAKKTQVARSKKSTLTRFQKLKKVGYSLS